MNASPERRASSVGRDDERLRLALDVADTLLCEFDLEGTITHAQGPFERVLDIAPGMLLGRRLADLPVIDASWIDGHRQACAGETTEVQHWLFDRAFMRTRFTPLRDAADAITGVRAVCRDLTTLALSSDAARASDEQLETVVDALPDGLVLVDDALRTIWANAAIRAFTGRSAEALAGTTTTEYLPPEEDARATAYLRACLAGGPAVEHQHLHVRAQDRAGQWREVRMTASRCALPGGAYGLLVHMQDATAERALTRELERRADETSRILDAVPMPVVIIDEHGTILRASATVLHTFGWMAEELTGENVELLADLPPGQHVAWMHHYAATGLPATLEGLVIGRTREVPARRRDGSAFPADLTVAALPREGAPSHFVGILQDVSARKAAEERLLQAQKSEAVGTLLAGVTHDFNNLLTSIIGGISLARDTRSDAATSAHWLEMALTAAERATTLVRQLLQVSRRTVASPTTVDLDELATETVALVRETIDRRIQIHLDAAAQGLLVRGDRGQLQQVLMNLVINARDAVTERMANAPPDYIPIVRIVIRPAAPAQDGGPRLLHVSVQDNGIGMPADVRTRIFDPFFTTKAHQGGTGLGLATSYSIVQGHGGALDVQSVPGDGTTITITLPAVAPEGGGQTAAPSVLVVDDEDTVRSIAVEVLQAVGYAVRAAASGTEALRLAQQARPDLVLLDVNMPRPNGWETLAALREAYPDLPVIMLSGYATLEEASAHGARGLVDKPYRTEELVAAVRAALTPGDQPS